MKRFFRNLLCKLFHRWRWRKSRWHYREDRPYRGVRYVVCDWCGRSWSESE